MKLSPTTIVASIVLLIALFCAAGITAVATPGYSITVVFDYETYASESYIRFSIDNPQNIPVRSTATAKLFDIQLPSISSNILESAPQCTRSYNSTNSMFFYQAQSNAQRGYEIMYHNDFDRTSTAELNCVIKIRAQPIVTGILTAGQNFEIKLLSAFDVFQQDAASISKTKTLTLRFALPQTSLQLTTSTRLYPDSYPFLYGYDSYYTPGNYTAGSNYEFAKTTPDVYTTTVTIDESLLKLRKNNKLIVKHPFSFIFLSTSSFCSTPHKVEPYDSTSESVVAQATETSPVDSIAISLLDFSSSAQGISCQISITPVLSTSPTIPASQVKLHLEYTYYNQTGTQSFSNYYKVFNTRTFQPIDPTTLFPAFESSLILATPPVAARREFQLAPMFLHPTSQFFPFWNHFSWKLENFAFDSNQALFVPGPKTVEIGGKCFQFKSTKVKDYVTYLNLSLPADQQLSFEEDSYDGAPGYVQVDHCVAEEALASCPDFDFRPADATIDGVQVTGIILVPKLQLRFIQSTCYFNFRWSLPIPKKVGAGYEPPVAIDPNALLIPIRIVPTSAITPVTLTDTSIVTPDPTDWVYKAPYSLRQSPQAIIILDRKDTQLNSTVANRDDQQAYNWLSPLIGGSITIDIKATELTPLSEGYRLEIIGPRLTSSEAIWVQAAWKNIANPRYNPRDITSNYTSGACTNCFELTTQLLQTAAGRAPDSTSTETFYYPILTYHGTDESVETQITLAYPGFKIPSSLTDTTANQIDLYHYNSQVATQKLTNASVYDGSIFFTMSKTAADVLGVFSTISWWKANTAQTAPTDPFVLNNYSVQAQKMKLVDARGGETEVEGEMAVQQAAGTTTNNITDEWAIYEQGYMGLLLKNTPAHKGDSIAISGEISLQTNSTTISNIVYCVGNVYTVPEDESQPWTIAPADTGIKLLVISTSSDGVIGTFTRELGANQAMSCTSTVIPRLPADATELLDIARLRYNSTLFSHKTSPGATYLAADYATSSTSYTYPFTSELPVDIVNVVPTVPATLHVYGNSAGNENLIFAGSYVTFQLTIQGVALTAGQSNAITIEFDQQRLQATDDAYDTVATFAPKLVCPNGETTISYQSSQTKVTIALTEDFVSTIQDPFICQFVMLVGVGEDFDTAIITLPGSQVLDPIDFDYVGSPYSASVAQTSIVGQQQFTISGMGPMPLILHQMIPFQSVNSTCTALDGSTVATISYNQALAVLIVTPTTASIGAVTSIAEMLTIDDVALSCSFIASKQFNAASTTVYFRVGYSVFQTDTINLPAITGQPDRGVDVLFSSIAFPTDSRPTHGLFLDIFHTPFNANDYITVNLPSGVNLDHGASSYNFKCDDRITPTTVFQPINMTTILTLSINSQITEYDEIQCALPITLSAPVAKTTLNFATTTGDSTGVTTDSVTTWHQSDWPQVTSNYRVHSSYGLQWDTTAQNGKGELQLVLEIEYTALAFKVRSNRLLYDFSGMKSPSDSFDATLANFAGGDPNIRVTDPKSDDNNSTGTASTVTAGAAVITSNLNAVNCYLPYVDPLGAQHSDHRISAQYIRETGYKLTISLPASDVGVPTQIRCIIPVYIYNQQFIITPTIIEFPTSQQSIGSAQLPSLSITTWFPSPSISIINNTPTPAPTPVTAPPSSEASKAAVYFASVLESRDPKPSTTHQFANARTNSVNYEHNLLRYAPTKLLGTTNPQLNQYLHPHYAADSKLVSRSRRPTEQVQDSETDIDLLDPFTTFLTAQDSSTTPINTSGSVVDPTSTQDLTQDIRYCEILFKQTRFFNNAELDDIINIIHSLVSKRDRAIHLNSLLVLAQLRPPLAESGSYVLLRIGFAGLDVEGTLLDAKFAGLDFSHWLSTSYEVVSYSLIDPTAVHDYHFSRTKVPITCLQTSASMNEITQTCGAECGRTCPNTYRNGGQRVCRTDLDCESLNCDVSTYTCFTSPWTFVDVYTGVYSGYGTYQQQSVTLQNAYAAIVAANPGRYDNPDDSTSDDPINTPSADPNNPTTDPIDTPSADPTNSQ